MSPWTILGWLILVVVTILFLLVGIWLLVVVWKKARIFFSYLRTRDTPLREGQRWLQGEDVLVIGKQHAEGHFTIRSGPVSWGETPEKWKERVRNRKLILLTDAKEDW